MYNWFSKATALVGVLAISLTACKKDETRVTMKDGVAPVLTASATTATLTSATAANTALVYTWTPADFGYKAAVTYTLQFAKKGDNFKTTQDISMGATLTKTLTGKELNNLYNALDCNISSTPSATPLDVRVKAVIGDAVAPVLSNTVGVTAVPYQAQTPPADTWGIIGAATPGGWNTDTPMTYDFCTRTWQVTLALTAGEFKFRSNNSWTVNLGEAATPTGNASTTGRQLAYNVAPTPNPANLNVATAGTYRVTLNLNATGGPIYTLK
ncbi:MAG: hypothetical protein JWP58_1527 [Hymenobacter sp.]|nr:hypothetical protein [Hymenobacter sp.]